MSDIPAPPGPPPARWRSATALELVAYMAAALLAVRGCWGKTVGSGGDIFGTLWYQEWIDHCVRAGVSPNWTPWLYHPEGMDLFAHNGGNYVDMLIGLPFYWLLGSPGHMAPVTVLILVGNAVAMRTLLRSLVRSRLAILAACLVFELHPFMLAELNGGRPTQALLWFWPLALHHLLAMRDDRRWRRPILAGGFVALQALVYWFTGHMFLLAFGPLLVIFGLRQAKDWWLRLGLAAGITLLVVAPFVVSIWPHISAGWLTTGGQDAEHSRASVRLHAYPFINSLAVVPWWGLISLATGLAACRRRSLWLPAAILCFLALAGPSLAIAGWSAPNPLWALADTALPGFERFYYPDRFWAPLALVGCVALAEAIDARIRPRLRPLAVVAAILLGMAPLRDSGHLLGSLSLPEPVYVDAVLAEPGVVLDLPLLCSHDTLIFQGRHRQPILGGMADGDPMLRPPGLLERVHADPLLTKLERAAVGAGTSPGPVDGEHLPRWVVLHLWQYRRGGANQCWRGRHSLSDERKATMALVEVERLLGPPHEQDDWAAAWDLTRLAQPDQRGAP